MQRTSSRLAVRMAVTMLCVGALTLPMHTAAAASSDTSPLPSSAITVADLADSSADQQRWLSEPDSRIALNPSHRQTDDARPKPDNSLDTMYYADQRKRTADAVVRNSFTRGDRPEAAPAPADEGDLEPALSERFSDGGAEQRWRSTNNGGTLRVDATGGTVSPGAGTSWGAVGRDITVDVEADPVLLVTVASATGTWALKVAPRGGTDRTA